MRKFCLSYIGDKRYLLEDAVHSLAHAHGDIPTTAADV